MAGNVETVQRQQQSAAMVPEHILGKSVLKMSLQDLQQFLELQIAENPALALEEDSRCPICGCVLAGDSCPVCGSESMLDGQDAEEGGDDWQEGLWTSPGRADDECHEPFSHVAAPKSLAEHLKEQLRVAVRGEERRVAEFLIDSLDEDGYLREPLVDIASRFKISVPQLESILKLVQGLDPAGVGARNLRECLLIQIGQLDDSNERWLAETIIRNHWEGVERMKLDRIAFLLGIDTASVAGALAFIRDNLTPYPAGAFRDPWQKLAPRRESRQVPDVRVRSAETGLVAEMLDPVTGRAALDETYSDLYSEIMRKRNGYSESDRAHIRECVQAARSLIQALEFRKTTLQRVAEELIRCQADFITKGVAYLKPLTRKELARRLGVHESTVCRATSDKLMQLPSGEVISFNVFFDSALPVKELVRRFATERIGSRVLSDGEIAEKLKALGISIARRTVAKYRDQLHVLPIEYRMAA